MAEFIIYYIFTALVMIGMALEREFGDKNYKIGILLTLVTIILAPIIFPLGLGGKIYHHGS